LWAVTGLGGLHVEIGAVSPKRGTTNVGQLEWGPDLVSVAL
jgi:hypothetical protein